MITIIIETNFEFIPNHPKETLTFDGLFISEVPECPDDQKLTCDFLKLVLKWKFYYSEINLEILILSIQRNLHKFLFPMLKTFYKLNANIRPEYLSAMFIILKPSLT